MEEKKVSWLELFFDLVFVTAVSFTTHVLVNADLHPDRINNYILEFLLVVFPMFWLWIGQTMFFNRFSELVSRPTLFMLPQMFCLILMTASFNFGYANLHTNFLLGYIIFRILTVVQYILVEQRRLNNAQYRTAHILALIFSINILITASSLLFHGQWRYIIMYIGIFADIILPLFFGKTLAHTPVNLPHLTERFGAFVIIALGESLVSITSILADGIITVNSIAFTALSFILISSMWASYFYDFEHTFDRKLETNGQLLLYGHFFILAAIMVLAATLHMLYANVLPKNVLTDFLFGSAALFFVCKHFIFYRHRKKELQYKVREMTGIFILMVVFYLINHTFEPPLVVTMLSLYLCFGIEITVQQTLYSKVIFKRKRRQNKKAS